MRFLILTWLNFFFRLLDVIIIHYIGKELAYNVNLKIVFTNSITLDTNASIEIVKMADRNRK